MKRGQAAFEFLMTYGWALLVVLVALSALAFFGVFSQGGFLPDQCLMFAGFNCISYYASSSADQLLLTFKNGLAYPMNFQSGPAITNLSVFIDDVSLPPPSCPAPPCTLSSGLLNCQRQATLATPRLQGNIDPGASFTCVYDLPPFGYNSGGPSVGTRLKGRIFVRWVDVGANNALRTREGTLAVTVEP